MADYELIALDTTGPNLRAPRADDNGKLVGGLLINSDRQVSGNAENMTDLRTMTGKSGEIVYLKAHTTAGDGGNGEFRWVSGAAPGTYVDNNGTIIVPTGGDGSAAWVSEDRVIRASAFGARAGENVTKALQAMSAYAKSIGTGFHIVVDCGEAYVFEQESGAVSGQPYYRSTGNVIDLSGCSNFVLDMTGSKLVTEPGLRFGSFDPDTGEPMPSRQTGNIYAANIGSVINLQNCSNYTVINPDLDGNNANLELGGQWGDAGRQNVHIGIREFNAVNGTLLNPKCKYFGLDGMYVGGANTFGLTHINPVCDYNGRQGLSWTGGRQLTLVNPNYSNTGQGAVASAPRAGIDIEDNGAGCFGLEMINPILTNNAGSDFLSLKTTDAINIRGGILFSKAGGSASVWVESEGVQFHGTKIYGPIKKATKNPKFNNCHIEDAEYQGEHLADGTFLIDSPTSAEFNHCEIISNRQNRVYINSANVSLKDTNFRFRADNPAARSRAAVMRFGRAHNVNFIQEYTNLNPAVEVSGEYTYIDFASTGETAIFSGDNRLIGSCLAYNSRSGAINRVIGVARKISPISESFTVTASGTEFDIPVGSGPAIIIVTNGNNRVVLIQATVGTSSSAFRHGLAILTSALQASGAFTFTTAVVSGEDVLRITEGTVTLAGTSWSVRKVPIGFSESIQIS